MIALQHLGLFPQLSLLFDRIHIPRRVREEFRKRVQSRKLLTRLVAELALYRYCNCVDEVNLRLLLDEVPRRARANEGEAEAVLQAAEIGAETVIVDDPLGRRWAGNRGIRCVGILGILETLRAQEVIPSVTPLLETLARNGYRLPGGAMRRLQAKFSEL